MNNIEQTELLVTLRRLLFATDHYGFSTEASKEFWESSADTAAANGQTSDDLRRAEWENARQVHNRITLINHIR